MIAVRLNYYYYLLSPHQWSVFSIFDGDDDDDDGDGGGGDGYGVVLDPLHVFRRARADKPALDETGEIS